MSGNIILKFDIFGEQIIKYEIESQLLTLSQNIEQVKSHLINKLTEEVKNLDTQITNRLASQLDEKTTDKEVDLQTKNQILPVTLSQDIEDVKTDLSNKLAKEIRNVSHQIKEKARNIDSQLTNQFNEMNSKLDSNIKEIESEFSAKIKEMDTNNIKNI